jgi:hypothetical protein
MEYYSHRFQQSVIVRLTCLSHCLVDDKAQARKASITGLLVIDGCSLIGVKGLQHTTFCSTFLAEQGTRGMLDLQCQKLEHPFGNRDWLMQQKSDHKGAAQCGSFICLHFLLLLEQVV